MITWNKDYKKSTQLGTYFSTKEFQCKCRNKDCVEQQVEIDLINKLDDLREELGLPITVTSGFRCRKHQVKIRASGISTVVAWKTSSHEEGGAADITCSDMKKLKKLAPKYFKAIGLAEDFIHVDLRADKTRRWKY